MRRPSAVWIRASIVSAALWSGSAIAQDESTDPEGAEPSAAAAEEAGGDASADAAESASDSEQAADGGAETPDAPTAESDADSTDADEAEAEAEARGMRVTTLREAETRSRRLKEDIFRSKATLALLEELLIESATLGSGVRVTHVNQLTKGYQVESIDYFLDGRPLFAWEASEGSVLPKELELRNETVPPGEHLLQVVMKLRGRGGGVFGYVDNIEFTLQSTHEFDVRPGRVRTLQVVATTKGGKGARSYAERPRIQYVEGGEPVEAE